MTNPVMAVNPLLTAAGQQRIPLIPSPFGPPVVDRDTLPSVVPTDPRQFCVPSQYGSSVLPNTNVPNMLPNPGYSGWGIVPSESIKAVTRRNEMIQRHHNARSELEMYAIYQQRRMEKVNPKGLAALGVPFLYGSGIPSGPVAFHGRSMLPASDLHFHRSALRHLPENPILMATRPHLLENWRQKYRSRRGTGSQKPLDSDTESSKSQAEEKVLGQMPAVPYEEDEYAKGPEIEICHSQKSSETSEKTTPPLTNPCAALQPTPKKPWGAWDCGKEEAQSRRLKRAVRRAGFALRFLRWVCLVSVWGTHVLFLPGENPPLDEDIQKWTVDDVHNFIKSLPGCSDCAQVFKDHAIDGETLPLLTEEHLRGTMGLKLGPALKIQSQVSQHVGSIFYKKTLSLPTHTRQALDQPADISPLLDFNSWSDTLSIPCSQDS
uniref:Sterile alpha motif domain containing 7 n=1 Tax=Cavia porcellus TaxID=10141 RepID=H0W7G2_CAVPO